ncbi:MAG: Uncharacterized protein G01um101424_219 [Parcubacteria group bacterium Gr01-1014_24]|nr:MAG: Uncharacterized protein G01um101424_219 [Parcubacteria group bacterium Gr01-1014_24]
MSKKNIALIVIVVLVVVGVALWSKYRDTGNSISVVYLSTGEVYIGKLSTFPMMELKNGYILATAPDATDPKKSNFQLNPLTEALWAPKHLYLNRKHVVFYGPILPNSKIAEALAAKK